MEGDSVEDAGETGEEMVEGKEDSGDAGKRKEDTETGSSGEASGNRKDRETEREEDIVEEGEA